MVVDGVVLLKVNWDIWSLVGWDGGVRMEG